MSRPVVCPICEQRPDLAFAHDPCHLCGLDAAHEAGGFDSYGDPAYTQTQFDAAVVKLASAGAPTVEPCGCGT